MQRISHPTFGKRNVLPAAIVRPQTPTHAPVARGTAGQNAVDPDHSAFFAAVRAEMADPSDTEAQAVRRSWKAAWLTGLVVGCALAGFDVTGQAGADQFAAVARTLGAPPIDGAKMLPR